MAKFVCNTSSDCDVIGDAVVRQCFKDPAFSLDNNICDCSLFFGWRGFSCDEETNVLWYHRISATFLGLWSLLNAVLALRTILLNAYIQGIKVDYLFITLACIFVSSSSSVVYESLGFVLSLSPDSFEVVEVTRYGSTFEEIAVKGLIVQQHMAIIGPFFGTFALFALMFSQERLMETLCRFESASADKINKRRQSSLRIFTAIYFPLVFALVVSDQLGPATILVTVVNLICPLVQIMRTRRIINSLMRMNMNSRNNVDVLLTVMNFIQFTRTVTTVCLFGTTIFSLTIKNSLDRMDKAAIHGEFHFAHFHGDISITFSLILFSTIAWYVNSVTPGAIVADVYPKCCCIFKLWDRQNLKLIPEEDENEINLRYSKI